MASGLAASTNISGGRNVASAGLLWSDSSAIDGLLTGEDVRALFRLRKIIEPDLARRSVKLLRPLDIARLERQVTLLGTGQLGVEEMISVHESFYLGLLRPAITNSELQVVRFLLDELAGHFRTGLRLLGICPSELIDHRTFLRELLDSFRGGASASAEAAMREHIKTGEAISLRLAGED
jgi:DNA-binding GntR family transcriptional regulator